MFVSLSMSLALAGEVFLMEDLFGDIYSFESRHLELTYKSLAAGIQPTVPGCGPITSTVTGADYDPQTGLLYMATTCPEPSIISKVPEDFWGNWVAFHQINDIGGLSFDSNFGLLAFGDNIWQLDPAPQVDFGPLLPAVVTDYYDDGGVTLAVQSATADVYAYVPGLAPWWVATLAHDGFPMYTAAGYDADLKIFWVADYASEMIDDIAYQLVTGYDPQSWDVVARVWLLATQAMGGSRDNVPLPQPALLVTGECPGTVHVTVADATPGGEVLVVSGTTAGTRAVQGGPCAGSTVDLADPRLRGRLRVRANGLATASFVAPPQLCGALQIQAVDTSTCVKTATRVVETAVVAPDILPP